MKQLKLFPVIFFILLFSCKSNNNQSGEDAGNVSATTNTSAGDASDGNAKLSCMIDGKAFSVTEKTSTIPFNLKQNGDGSLDGVTVNIGKHPDNTNAGFQFTMNITGHTTIGQRVKNTNGNCGSLYQDADGASYGPDSVEINITSNNHSLISGTFSGIYGYEFGNDADSKNRKTITVTDGKFQMPIMYGDK
ncbi:MAG TPA: hypothetical protein VGP55_03915 [Chitinophagaceae bacterium]|nr:hypothetical protein [Chitinophagaceae bacterium]